MIEYISDLRLFLTISRTLNFREAGDRLGYSPAVVTTRIQRLEAVTGKSLFVRSTRHIKLTEEGQQIVRLAEQIVDLSEQMSSSAKGSINQSDLKGTVRVAAPHSFARLFLLQPLQHLLADHPELTIDLILEDSISKMVEEGIDISFRVGGDVGPNLQGYDLFKDRRILIAAPQYLDTHGTPTTPQELRNHQCLTYSHMKYWTLLKRNRSYRVQLKDMMFCNTGDFLSKMAISGAGITIKSLWSVQEEINRGELVHVMPDYTAGPDQIVRALILRRDYIPVRVIYALTVIRSYIDANINEVLVLD